MLAGSVILAGVLLKLGGYKIFLAIAPRSFGIFCSFNSNLCADAISRCLWLEMALSHGCGLCRVTCLRCARVTLLKSKGQIELYTLSFFPISPDNSICSADPLTSPSIASYVASGSLSTLPRRYTTGTMLTFTCGAGYAPAGDTNVVTCNSLGYWQPYNPNCTGKWKGGEEDKTVPPW